jgi:hypothetical protein
MPFAAAITAEGIILWVKDGLTYNHNHISIAPHVHAFGSSITLSIKKAIDLFTGFVWKLWSILLYVKNFYETVIILKTAKVLQALFITSSTSLPK